MANKPQATSTLASASRNADGAVNTPRKPRKRRKETAARMAKKKEKREERRRGLLEAWAVEK
jgi:hypothetical protein